MAELGHQAARERQIVEAVYRLDEGSVGRVRWLVLLAIAAAAVIVAAIFVPFGTKKLSVKAQIWQIAVPEPVQEVTIKGKMLRPDGSPVEKGFVSTSDFIYTIPKNASLIDRLQGRYGSSSGGGGGGQVKKDGTFEFQAPVGGNVIVIGANSERFHTNYFASSGYYIEEPEIFVCKPFAFSPKADNEELVLQLEEPAYVSGFLRYEDGKPVVKQPVSAWQYVTPAIGADLPFICEQSKISLGAVTDHQGKFVFYLYPGEYHFVAEKLPWFCGKAEEKTVVVEAGKENQLDLTMESPVHVRFVLEDGTYPEELNVIHAGAYAYLGRQDSINTFLYQAFDTEDNTKFARIADGDAIPVFPSEMNNYIIVTSYDNQYGLVEKITPQMRGQEITLTLRPTIAVTEKKGTAGDYFTRTWQFQYITPRRYSIQRGTANANNRTFVTDADGNLTWTVPVYAGDYQDLLFYLVPGQGGSYSGGRGGTGKPRTQDNPNPLFRVNPKTRQIEPASNN